MRGLHFHLENRELAEVLKTWHSTLDDIGGEKNGEEAAELVRTLIEKKGIMMKLLCNDDHLESAVNQWNEKNKQLSELRCTFSNKNCTYSFNISIILYSPYLYSSLQ